MQAVTEGQGGSTRASLPVEAFTFFSKNQALLQPASGIFSQLQEPSTSFSRLQPASGTFSLLQPSFIPHKSSALSSFNHLQPASASYRRLQAPFGLLQPPFHPLISPFSLTSPNSASESILRRFFFFMTQCHVFFFRVSEWILDGVFWEGVEIRGTRGTKRGLMKREHGGSFGFLRVSTKVLQASFLFLSLSLFPPVPFPLNRF